MFPKFGNDCGDREETLAELRRLGVKRVFLAGMTPYPTTQEEKDATYPLLKENCDFFHKEGFEVACWHWAFGYVKNLGTTMIKGSDGAETTYHCPFDDKFLELVYDNAYNLAKCGVDMIQYDDDFGFSYFGNSLHCTCDLHMARIREILGEDISPEELQEKVLRMPNSKYRLAWMQANGESLKKFASTVRSAINEVNPKIRAGVCTNMGSWGLDGATAEEISRTFAGDEAAPFLRLIGASYWPQRVGYHHGTLLSHVIEYERLSRSHVPHDIEAFGEGDPWPRPRNHCPAANVELFDMGLRIDGTIDGILKYDLDYYAQPDYETGYIDRHVRNKPVYDWIDKAFSDKKIAGVRVYDTMDKYKGMKIPESVTTGRRLVEIFYNPAIRMLCDSGVPTTYTNAGVCGIAFDENVRIVPKVELKRGLIIDMRAAEILAEDGIDVGIIKKGDEYASTLERFVDGNRCVNIHEGAIRAYKVELNPNVKVLSYLRVNENGKTVEYPVSYTYENANGEKFLVFAFDAYYNNRHLGQSYARARELRDVIASFGTPLPAHSLGNPNVHMMTKKSDNALAVGYFNIFADTAFTPTVTLDGEYSEVVSTINCTAELHGNKVILSDIPPFSFAGFEVKK